MMTGDKLEQLYGTLPDGPAETDELVSPVEEVNLPEAFWNERPVLEHIRQAAHSRGRSADAILVGVLARVAADLPHVLRLPPIVGSPSPLCLYGILVGDTGRGKSTAWSIASELVRLNPDRVRTIPPGSGEGLVDAYFDTTDEDGKRVLRQVRHNVHAYFDEGTILGAFKDRRGSTLLEMLRALWSGSLAGQHNATADRKRVLSAGSYTIGLIVAIQEEKAGALLADAASGTPGRFLWARAIDPLVPAPGPERPDWPGPLPYRTPSVPAPGELSPLEQGPDGAAFLRVAPQIREEIMDADHARVTGRGHVDALDAHAGLIRLRLAAMLGILDGRFDVAELDWYHAGDIMEASNRARAHAAATVVQVEEVHERKDNARLVRREEALEEAKEHRRLVRLGTWIGRKVWGAETYTRRELKNAASSEDRNLFDEALEHATAEGYVIEVAEPGQGEDKRRLRRGANRPPGGDRR